MGPHDEEITALIARWQRGDKDSENAIFEALYERLHTLALAFLRNEPQKVLSPTSLVHSAYLRILRSERLEIADRAHFLRLAAQVMRRIVVDKARRRKALKREGTIVDQDIDSIVRSDGDADEIIAVDRGLDELAKQSARLAQLIELKHFAGFTFDEASAVMKISARQLRRDWPVAMTRLRIAIDGSRADRTL